MAYDFHVGQKVVCVDARNAANLVERRIYTIASVKPTTSKDVLGRDVTVSVLLVEAKPNAGTRGFNAARFRPLVKRQTSIEIFKKLLHPTPSRVEEDA